jgi:hypothetical protein
MTIALLAALAMQGLPVPTPPALPAPTLPDWQRLGGNASGEFAIWPSSIRRSGNEVSAIVRLDITRGQRTGARVLGVLRYVFNCQVNTFRLEAGDLYGADGARVGPAPLRPEHRTDQPVPAGTPNASVRDHLCRGPGQ